MKILVIGSGGREHALAWALSRSARRPEVYVAPGNAGTASVARNVPVKATDVEGLARFAQSEHIDLTVVGPEQPLVMGLVDRFQELGLPVVGPTAAAARLEGSKAFSKDFMVRHGVPTARHRTFRAGEYEEALGYLREVGAPVVLKASGLAAGKGAVVCESEAEAEGVLRSMMVEGDFGEAADEVVVEEFMRGEEVSIFVLTDGSHYLLLPSAQDHKRIGEGDTGPNTGGMGAYAPAPIATGSLLNRVCQEIIQPTIAGMAQEGNPYQGILYCGIMVTDAGPRVVEFNCRLGDPEAQAVLPLIDSDLATVFERLAAGKLNEVSIRTGAGAAACVVVASAGYPGAYETGVPIEGLEQANADSGVVVFHAGTKPAGKAGVVTAGGRVLGVTGLGHSLQEALDRAYAAIGQIDIPGMQYRRDIGWRGLARQTPA